MKTSTKVLNWTARILCILAFLIVGFFVLDSVSPNHTFWQNTASLLISLILLAVLISAWKWEKTGGIILTIVGLAVSIFIFVFNYKRHHFPVLTCLFQALLIAGPFLLAGILFIISHYRKNKEV
jgi:peptidoglycan/LPS O-acetylase OafA/YrhL